MCARFVSRGAPFHAFPDVTSFFVVLWPFFFVVVVVLFFLLRPPQMSKKKKKKNRKKENLLLDETFSIKRRKKKTVHEEEIKMAGKAKPKKHTAKELKQKQDAALTNKGGGKKAGLQDRKGGAAGHAKSNVPSVAWRLRL